MKIIIFILFFNLSNGQNIIERWNKLPSEKRSNIDHTLDFYSRMGLSWGTSEIINHYTHKPILSGAIGLGAGIVSSFFERGPYGKCVSIGGSITGNFAFIIHNDIKERRKKDYNEKRLIFEN